MIRFPTAVLFSAASLCLTTAGCQNNSAPAPQEAAPTAQAIGDAHDHAHDAHDHASEGPHHGVLVELGDEEYHAEVVHEDSTGLVTVYLLDSSAKKSMTSDSPEITINLKHDGKPEQFKLAAQPQEGEAAGQTSRYSITDKELATHLHEEGTEPRLSVTIGGQPYSAAIPHEAHAGHDHAHDHSHQK